MKIINWKDRKTAWGLEASINLYGCNPEIIRDSDLIKEWIIQLCDLIDMKRFGESEVVHFGEDEKIAGYSALQLIETSLVSAHFANQTNAAYINIFSCKEFDPKIVEDFCWAYFKAKDVWTVCNYRL
jgi:S-adenosylmethionine/arginine decarboxylase-like enzyme